MNPSLHESVRALSLRKIGEWTDIDKQPAILNLATEPATVEVVHDRAVDRATRQASHSQDLHDSRVDRVPRMSRLQRRRVGLKQV